MAKKEEVKATESTDIKGISKFLSEVDKKYGKGTVIKMDTSNIVEVGRISSGSIGLDLALGGGWPVGRVIEIFGPESSGKSTLAIQAIAEVQKEGGVCLYIDAEHSFDSFYAANLGVDVDSLLLNQPENGEQGMNILDDAIRSKEFQLIIIDSVSALTPKAVIEGESGSAHMGLLARLMSQCLSKVVGTASKNNVTIIFINQIRMKIGVMFGCFGYDSRVMTEKGSMKIGYLVNNKVNTKVLSYNKKENRYEFKKILNYYNNGRANYFIQFELEKYGENGKSGFYCTPNHKIFLPSLEEVDADSLNVGDYVAGKSIFGLSPLQKEIVYGSILGDGSISKKGNRRSLSFGIGHGYKQKDYCYWKFKYFTNISSSICENKKGTVYFDIRTLYEFKELRDELYNINGGGKRKRNRKITKEFLNKLTPLSLAIWYMDDGNYSPPRLNDNGWGYGKLSIPLKSYTLEDIEIFKQYFIEKLDIIPANNKSKYIMFCGENCYKFQCLISKYIHPSMNYKLLGSLQNDFKDFDPEFIDLTENPIPVKILKKYLKPITRSMIKFDLEIEDNHNYVVDGILVHNSPETTSGGEALKFYSSVRCDVRRIGTEKDKEDVITASKTRVKVIKNKTAPPFRQAEFLIVYGEGISIIDEVIDVAVENNIINKSGSWYSYGDTKLGQGAEAVKIILKDNPELFEEIKNKIVKLMKS